MLAQDQGVDGYVKRLEELKFLISVLIHSLLESYYILSFISGLRKDVRPILKIHKPIILVQAFKQTKWQEESNIAIAKKGIFLQKGNLVNNNEKAKLHMIAGCDKEKDEFMVVVEWDISGLLNEGKKIEEYSMSLNVLAESYANNTIRTLGCYQGKNLIILIDSESINNFIDELVIKEIKTVVRKAIILEIIIANGSTMRCDNHSPGFIWFMQSYEFKVDLRILKLKRYDMVLGMDWLRCYSSILFNFIKMKLSLMKGGRMIEVKGIMEESSLQIVTA